MNKLLILDGNSLLHRAYYALPDWRNRSGEATAGVYGFLSMMLKAIEDLRPTHLIVVFDHPSPTFRHIMYVGYQTNREKQRQVSEDIWGQVDKLQLVLEKMHIPTFQISGFEADDIIGTLSLQASNSRIQNQVVIITGDRDMMQLVDEKIKLYMPVKGLSDTQIIDGDRVREKLGVWPEQVIDYKGLVGDSSDNYPGVAGIGPKTAVQLLDEFGSFENIYKSLVNNAPSNPPLKSKNSSNFSLLTSFAVRGGRYRGDISEGVAKKLIDGYEAAVLSKQLATIKTDVPLTLNWDKSDVPGQSEILGVLKELGYKSLIKRIGGKEDEDRTRPRLFE